jgi:hypothetical protein
MSGTMHHAVAQAAARLAQQAIPMPEGPGRAAFRAKREELAKADGARRAASEAWAGIPPQWKALFAITLPDGDPEQIALSPWGALTEAQREALGNAMRGAVRDLQHRAAALRA